jgi:hypothetical protein
LAVDGQKKTPTQAVNRQLTTCRFAALRIARLAFPLLLQRMETMKAIPAPSTSKSETGDRVRRASILLPLILLVIGFHVAAEEQDVTAAVWKVREVGFFYRSSVAVYSCHALEARVATILRAVGARDDVQVDASHCEQSIIPQEEPLNTWRKTPSDGYLNRRASREQQAHVRVRLLMPTEVTPEVLAEMERDKTRRELVSRVTGDPSAKFDDPIVFTARRQPVTLSRQSIGLEPLECELLEQMSTGVFRKLDIRVVSRSSSCGRNQISHIPPQLTVEALIGTPLPTSNIQQTPPAGEKDPETGEKDPEPSISEK